MFACLISLLILQRIFELIVAERNRRWALAHGGVEIGGRRYPVIVAVHSLFFVSIVIEWHVASRGWNPAWPCWLAVLLAAQALRCWAMGSLGPYWNTRIIVLPGMPPVLRGPFRFVRHPNYLAVIAEIGAIPMICGAYFTAIAFTVANALLLVQRIPEEERALKQASSIPMPHLPRFFPRLRRSGKGITKSGAPEL